MLSVMRSNLPIQQRRDTMQRKIEYFAELSCRLEPVRQRLLQLAEVRNVVC